jgi:uncharacterized membrane protein|uniref:DUF4870 domain-containing protein n=1 Tax=candidate division CPR3 bacterium TaxID=2268181 RepID=A0A7C5UUR6_UNCC3
MEKEVNETKEAPQTPAQTTGGGSLDPKVAILLSWLIAPLTSIIFIAIEKKDRRVKFHAWESLFWGIFNILIGVVFLPLISILTLGFGGCLFILYPFLYVVNIIAAIKGWNGEDWKLPVIGEWAEKQVNK